MMGHPNILSVTEVATGIGSAMSWPLKTADRSLSKNFLMGTSFGSQ
jgi:hypothetical protein